jgi:hypothetical protein
VTIHQFLRMSRDGSVEEGWVEKVCGVCEIKKEKRFAPKCPSDLEEGYEPRILT